MATITGETVSAQTVSKLTRDLDEAVRQFHQARLHDDYAYLFLDGVSLRVRRSTGRKQVQMLVAYGIRRDGSRHLLAFLRSQGEGQADWEGLLQDLYRRGLEGQALGLILTDGCAGLAGLICTVYPRVRHQRCWVHKMRNILEKVRKRDYDEVKAGAQAIYLAESRAQAVAAFRVFRSRWCRAYPAMVRRVNWICRSCCRSSLSSASILALRSGQVGHELPRHSGGRSACRIHCAAQLESAHDPRCASRCGCQNDDAPGAGHHDLPESFSKPWPATT